MKKIVLITSLLLQILLGRSQQKPDEPKFGINFSGFVKTDIFYDTRQTVNIREGHFLLYPENKTPDSEGKDIYNKPAFNILSIQSRLKGSIVAPDAFGARTSGVIEADFFGNENSSFSDVNGFRMRHAFVKLNWKNAELLVGQYWHPMFIAESFPGVVSFNTGAPFQPFSRNPQVRFSKSFGGIKLIGVMFSQRDFTCIGPEYKYENNLYSSSAVASSKYIRNAGMPNLHFQVQFNPDSTNHLMGVGIDYKTIMPEQFTISENRMNRYNTNKKISSISYIAFARLAFKPFTVKLEGIVAENAYDMVMLGGYAVEQVNDVLTGDKDFTNIKTYSVWLDANTNGKKIQYGLFAGYTGNLGASETISTTTFYSRGKDIDYVYRVAPRVTFISGKLDIAIEFEYTVAAYGKTNGNTQGGVTQSKEVANTRGLVAFVYKF